MNRSLAAVLSALVLVSPLLPGESQADVHGRIEFDAGSIDHPLGIAAELSTPYLNARLGLDGAARIGDHRWKFTYEGSAFRFDPDVGLDFQRHAAGLEWIRPAANDAVQWSAGAQFSMRDNQDFYAVYDQNEVYGYLAFKTYPAPSLMVRGYVGARGRRYSELPEESYYEPHAVLVAKRFWENRTTLGATVRIGGKWFYDDVAPRVWGTSGTPSAAQISGNLDFAKGLTERVGLQASVGQRAELSSFPYYVEADVYDSPLLDRYARAGSSARVSIKALSIAQIWVESGGAWRGDDYGDIVFADGATGSLREDTVVDAFLSLQRRFLTDGRGAILNALVSWREQDSTLATYTWDGWMFSGGIEWRW